MEFLNKCKKGQALPLNTIVIAILVIIVLLVIIVFFTTQVGDTGKQLEQNSPNICGPNNPALATLGYTEFKSINVGDKTGEVCDTSTGWKNAVGVNNCCVK